MVLYAVDCANCGERRVGPESDGEVQPYRSECPNCGETDFKVPAKA